MWIVIKAEVAELFNEFTQNFTCGEGNHKKKIIYYLCHNVYLPVSATQM